jgi:hypothetical protein
MLRVDVSLDIANLQLQSIELTENDLQSFSSPIGKPVHLTSHEGNQAVPAVAASCSNQYKFGHVGTHGVDQLGALAHQPITRPVQHQYGLLLGRLHGNEPHARSRHCLAYDGRIGGIVLAALAPCSLPRPSRQKYPSNRKSLPDRILITSARNDQLLLLGSDSRER